MKDRMTSKRIALDSPKCSLRPSIPTDALDRTSLVSSPEHALTALVEAA
jgi:hypothetical protein